MISSIPSFAQDTTIPQTRVKFAQNLLPNSATGTLARAKFEPLSVLSGQTDEYIKTHSIVNNVVQGVSGPATGKSTGIVPMSDAEIKKLMLDTIV